MAQKKQKINDSKNNSPFEEIFFKTKYCEKCSEPLIEEIYLWDSTTKKFVKKSQEVTCVACNKA
jgi:RNase P subunit RPR2